MCLPFTHSVHFGLPVRGGAVAVPEAGAAGVPPVRRGRGRRGEGGRRRGARGQVQRPRKQGIHEGTMGVHYTCYGGAKLSSNQVVFFIGRGSQDSGDQVGTVPGYGNFLKLMYNNLQG